MSPLERLGPEGYTSEVSQRVYAALSAQAAAVVRSGYSAVVDAVFARPPDRTAIEQAARDAGVPFFGLWLEAPEPVLAERLRRRTVDASDADADVLRMQEVQGAGRVTWQRLDASATATSVLASAGSCLATTAAA
jgi:predicted kinase